MPYAAYWAGIFPMKTYPLHTFVHRVLVVRLAIAAMVIAVAVGIVSYSVQRSQIENDAADLGRRGVVTLLEQVKFVMERQNVNAVTALQEVLAQGGRPAMYRAGSFVYLHIYDRSGTVLADKADTGTPGTDRIGAALAGRTLTFPGPEQDEAQVVRIDGRPFVLVTVPIRGREGSIVIGTSVLLYPIILQLTRRLADYSTHLLDANLETLSVLGSAIAKRDSDTDAHNYRVTLYATRIGEAMNISQADMRVLVKGSFLHDVGKLGIPDSILLKPVKLDEQEFAAMKTHVDKGADIVGRSTWLHEGKAVVAYHHEKFAGKGYPHGPKGPEIPITARIFAVSDVFDALTSHRPYKKPLSFDETMSILELDRHKHFDPSSKHSRRSPGSFMTGTRGTRAPTSTMNWTQWCRNTFPQGWMRCAIERTSENRGRHRTCANRTRLPGNNHA
jgi:HD-GYP domain-containing protein (c-di-GMP phosphodiesterase class II)